ncbi:MAG: integration host factor subunit beta [Candidatus Omnitrophica bacterium]|nr:integration host factor subunit beta [Candidatus Omnitrophota bacterium]
MTKKDIVAKIAGESGIKQIDVKKIVQMTFDTITDALAKGEKIELRNFGVFKTKSRKGRMGRNPRTGQQVPVDPKRVALFKPGLVMKAKVK